MLEARKLSVQVQQDQAGKMWSWLSGLVWLTTLAVLASVWIGANFEAPPPDKSQEKMSAAHAQAVSVVANLNQMLAPEQELTPQLFEQLAALSAPLADFGQMAAVGLRISPDSQDTQTWPGKINAMVGDGCFEIVCRYFFAGFAQLKISHLVAVCRFGCSFSRLGFGFVAGRGQLGPNRCSQHQGRNESPCIFHTVFLACQACAETGGAVAVPAVAGGVRCAGILPA